LGEFGDMAKKYVDIRIYEKVCSYLIYFEWEAAGQEPVFSANELGHSSVALTGC
jgi:hypothetical protein